MSAPTVNTRESYGTATEKFAFEHDKSVSAPKTNLHQQKSMYSKLNFIRNYSLL